MEYSAEIKKSLDSLYKEINQKSKNVVAHLNYTSGVLNKMRNTEDKVARVASINSIITQIDQHIKYVESIPGTIKNIINNLNDIKEMICGMRMI